MSNMLSQLQKETVKVCIKNLLKENGIKLWLPPYYNENNEAIEEVQVTECLKELALNYTKILNVDYKQCTEVLLEWQKKCLYTLKERDQFIMEGIATIRVKISGQQIPEFSVQLKLVDTVKILKHNISQKIDVSEERLKLIFSGKVLKNEYILRAYNIKCGSTVLVLLLQYNEGEDVVLETQTNNRLIEETKKDIELLNNRKLGNGRHLWITNQNGFNLDLPPLEHKMLLTAMALHEKGRTAFKKEQYSLALVFFLEADEEFKSCHADILNKVDNYGLLNLDIVWIYLHMHSLHYLNDAEARLKICEKAFLKSYGSNFERLNSIKGSSENERILFVRLHLLQGILCHTLNKRDEALKLFESVENEIRSLKVDHDKLILLCKLGYSSKEARLALRATFNDLNAAVEYILRNHKEKALIENHEKIRIFADSHTCENGSQINLTVLKQLHDMGYSHLLGVQALMNANNEINNAVIWIENFISNLNNTYPLYIVDVITSLEFNFKEVLSILTKHKYKLNDLCIQELLCTTVIGREYMNKRYLNDDLTKNSAVFVLNDGPSNNSPTTSKGESSSNYVIKTEADVSILGNINSDTAEEEEAFNRLYTDISNSEDDHLNINLESEEKFLKLYKSLLL